MTSVFSSFFPNCKRDPSLDRVVEDQSRRSQWYLSFHPYKFKYSAQESWAAAITNGAAYWTKLESNLNQEHGVAYDIKGD